MTAMDYPVYDFLHASKVERPLAAALKVWTGKFANMFVERWRELAPTDISLTPMLIKSLSFEAAQSSWTKPVIAVPITIKDGAVQGMIIAQRVDLIILMMEILSETLTQRPSDRALTSIEISLSELFFQHSVASFGEAWPEKEIIPIKIGQLDDQPQRSRLFPPKREVLLTGFEIRTSCGVDAGPARIEWMFAKDEMTRLLGVNTAAPVAKNNNKIPVENISQVIVDVSAQLGSAELAMSDLMKLAVGDIVKLDQSIEHPLTLLINNHPAMHAWPGRKGDQQCFQVE